MNVHFTIDDEEKLARLVQIRDDNIEFLSRLADFLNYSANLITDTDVKALTENGAMSSERAYCLLLSAACGLEEAGNPDNRRLAREYFQPSVKQLEPAVYQSDVWLKRIRPIRFQSGRWEFRQESYQPYEAFIRADSVLTDDLREIPSVGYFTSEFAFPALLQDDREWMTVTPNEIETMREPIFAARGRVLTFGLGLGYFAFHAARKPETRQVVVVERDAELVKLFRQYFLPRFDNPDKIQIVEQDAFDFAETLPLQEAFDLTFVDLWHDTSDGVPLYVRMKRLERQQKRFSSESPSKSPSESPHWRYWIEPQLLSSLRWRLFDSIVETLKSGLEPVSAIGLPERAIQSFADVQYYLSDEFLKRWA